MDPIELEKFEQQIERLISECQQLKADKQKLLLSLAELHRERSAILQSNQANAKKIRLVATQLKEQLS